MSLSLVLAELSPGASCLLWPSLHSDLREASVASVASPPSITLFLPSATPPSSRCRQVLSAFPPLVIRRHLQSGFWGYKSSEYWTNLRNDSQSLATNLRYLQRRLWPDSEKNITIVVPAITSDQAKVVKSVACNEFSRCNSQKTCSWHNPYCSSPTEPNLELPHRESRLSVIE